MDEKRILWTLCLAIIILVPVSLLFSVEIWRIVAVLFTELIMLAFLTYLIKAN